MADSLPLIPEKGGSVCSDVRPVLRDVFKELDYLPPLAPERLKANAGGDEGANPFLSKVNHWIDKYDSERETIWNREGELKQQYVKRIARVPLPNIYKLHPSPNNRNKVPTWKTEQGILDRSDLIPTLVQNADRDETLWVKNILNRSSGDITSNMVTESNIHSPICLDAVDGYTLQSISIGDVVPSQPPPPPPALPTLPLPEHVLCVPPELTFVNFTLGKLHTQGVRLVNVSKVEVRLSVRPPSSRELDIELCARRGLTVTSGASTEIRVHFRPRDVRVLRDVLLVRVSTGKCLHVPILCYLEPPILDVLVPAISSSIFSCTPETTENNIPQSSDCLELGARLLGDVHCVTILLYCEAEHATFFLLTEDAWLSFCLDELTFRGSVVSDSFVVSPAWWRGGGTVRGGAWCRAGTVGLHTAALRVVSSTAVVRPLSLIADAIYFSPDHITLEDSRYVVSEACGRQNNSDIGEPLAHPTMRTGTAWWIRAHSLFAREAQEKDYDICSDDDPACDYYVHLGTAFPHRSLTAAVQMVNHSPVSYSYYWSVRVWGECSCWEELAVESTGSDATGRLCVGAKEAKDRELKSGPDSCRSRNANCVRVEPPSGAVAPRSSCSLYVCVPDVADQLGVQRAVLMLVLKNIPKESVPPGYDPMLIKSNVVKSDPIPGVKSWAREVCELVCAQMEVWWEVAPVRFVLDPPVLPLIYSRRVDSLAVEIRATQLFGSEGINCIWQVPTHVTSPAPIDLTSTYSCGETLNIQLPVQPDDCPQTDIIKLAARDGEWHATCRVTRQPARRSPALRPACVSLGVVPPGRHMHARLQIHNNTYQNISWLAEPFRCHGENQPSTACAHREPCTPCHERACSCALLLPRRGDLEHGQGTEILYDVNAPLVDGCVATLVAVRCMARDVAHVADVVHDAGVSTHAVVQAETESDAEVALGPGREGDVGSAALVAYRVLAPRLVLRVLPCLGDKKFECEGCAVDEGETLTSRGTATLRPRVALALGRRTCCRLRLTNLSPTPTRVTWDHALAEDVLKLMFIPKEVKIDGYAHMDIQVVVEARKVCGRRLHVYRAQVQHAYKPIYLIIDTAVSGLEIVCEVPLGGGETTDSSMIMRRTQILEKMYSQQENGHFTQKLFLMPIDPVSYKDQKSLLDRLRFEY